MRKRYIIISSLTENGFGYTNQRNHADMGLMDYNARFYSPTLGRFTQPDSIIPDLTNSQAWNRYTYVLNSPIMYVDPSGHARSSNGDDWMNRLKRNNPPLPNPNPHGHPDGNTHGSSSNLNSPTIIYWRGMTEQQLAGYSQDQGNTMNCGKYAVAIALSMLHGKPIDGAGIVDDIGGFNRYSFAFVNGLGSNMNQVKRLATDIANSSGLNHTASLDNPSTQELIDYLSDPNTLVLVSVTGFETPEITQGTGTTPKMADGFGHVMVLVAYDETHTDKNGDVRPWGFVSSWDDSTTTKLLWMSSAEFDRTFGNYGLYSSVIISIP